MKNNLRVILAKRKLTVAELSEMTGLAKSTLTQIYYERSNPSALTLYKIANVLGVAVDELLVGDE